MKRALAFATAMLLSAGLCIPSVAQDSTQPQNSSSPTPVGMPPNGQSASTNSPPDTQSNPKVKQGSKDDVDAIGTRKMGSGKSIGDWYSLDTEMRMGKRYAQMIESSVRLVQDPVVTEYVNRIGQNLVRNSDARVPFTIKVVDSGEINAFALPGGFFYVNSGLILAADEEAELAGVMSHEIAHVAARHAMREMTRMNMMNIASLPLIFVGSYGLYYGASAALSLAVPLSFMKFSRSFESEADYLGLQYMYKAGYDPQAFVSFFEKIQAKEKKKPGTLAKAFDSHPQTPDRIAHTQEEIRKILPTKTEYIVDTSEFDEVKARLAAIENRHKIIEDKDTSRPSLRRTKTANKDDKGNKNPDDDRPTLQRRDD